MKLRTRIVLVVGALLAVIVPVSGADALRPSDEATYRVTIHNEPGDDVTTGQPLTPVNFIAHTEEIALFEEGGTASVALQRLAEQGDVQGMAQFFTSIGDGPSGVSGVLGNGVDGGPILPNESTITFEFTTTAKFFSVVSSLVCTNDGFAGDTDRVLPRRVDDDGQVYSVRAWDAGTEVNTELFADLPVPGACGSTSLVPVMAGSGPDEVDGVITIHPSLTGGFDIPAEYDWEGRVVMHVTIVRIA